MSTMNYWQLATTLASVVSAIAIVAGTAFVMVQLRQAEKDRFFSVMSHLFEIWQRPDFQDDQLFLLHKLPATTWDELIRDGRGERAERVFHRVGGFYDRVGLLVKKKVVDRDTMLPTIAGYAIAVWQRIEPLVQEARKRENAFLFEHFEQLLPECRECYVPSMQSARPPTQVEVEFVEPKEARRLLDQDAAQMLDVRKLADGPKIRGALSAEPNELTGWLSVLSPDKPVITYCS